MQYTLIRNNNKDNDMTANSDNIEPLDNENNNLVYIVDDDMDDRLFSYRNLSKSDRVSEIRQVKSPDALF